MHRTEFTGYTELSTTSVIRAVAIDPPSTSASASGGEMGWVALSPCPFYAVGGGQVGDTGVLHITAAGQTHTVQVIDTVRPYPGTTPLSQLLSFASL